MSGSVTLIIAGMLMVGILGAVSYFSNNMTLNNIKSKTVGDGQHGTARWATSKEVMRIYQHIPFTPQKWRSQAKEGHAPTVGDKPVPQGIVVGCTGKKHCGGMHRQEIRHGNCGYGRRSCADDRRGGRRQDCLLALSVHRIRLCKRYVILID